MHSNSVSNFSYILCMLLALLSPHEATAQTQNGSDLTIAASVLHFGYKEFDDRGKLLDREDGYIPGFVLGLSHTSNRWVFAGDVSYHGGEVVYDGETQDGVTMTTRTAQNIADLALRTEYWLQSGKGSRYALYLGAGYYHWDRDILPGVAADGRAVGGLFETYAWWSGFLGAKAIIYESGASRWLLDTRLLQRINPTMTVRFNEYDSVRLALGERLGFKISLPWRYTMNKSTSLSFEPFAETYELGRSATTRLTVNGAPAFDNNNIPIYIFEPLSQTFNYGLVLGISQHF